MKLEIYTSVGWLPINNKRNYCTEYEYDGTQSLSFDLNPTEEINKYINNEVLVRNDENLYIIKSINKRKTSLTITCTLYLDDWYSKKPYVETKELEQFKTKTLSAILEYIKPNGWTITNAGIRSIQRTIELQDVTNYDVLINCQSVFNVVYEFDTINKIVRIIDPDTHIDTNIYITPQLNMQSLESTGDSKDFATRISAYGKKNEDGTYVNFSSINGGKDYVEDTSYAGKTKWIIWRDERYTVPESLLADAKKKLKKQAFPVLSYTINVNDLAQYVDEYSFLNFQLNYLAHTIIDENTSIVQSIVKIKRYHDSPEKNEITLSTEAKKITSKVDKISILLGDNGEKITGSILQQAQEKATALINQWAEKGFIYLTQNEIYILDKLPKETAKFCIRMNLAGIAFSQNGWQGPYISAWTIDGRFNADFITAGVLRAINIEGTTIKGSTISGNSISGGSINGTTITNGNNFNVDAQGNMTASNGSFTGVVNATSGNFNGVVKTIATNGFSSTLTNGQVLLGKYNDIYGKLSASWNKNNASDHYLALTGAEGSKQLHLGVDINRESNFYYPLYIMDFSDPLNNSVNRHTFFGGITVNGDCVVRGAKPRVVETKLYGNILMCAVESADPVFEDYGTAQLNNDGKCVVRLEDKFLSTVNTDISYFTFITPLDEGSLFVKNKYKFAFIVHGTPNLKFDWRVTVKQKGYENYRMKEFKKEGV